MPKNTYGPLKIGTSACLTGRRVRYDGLDKRDRYITDVLSRYIDVVPVCPEVEFGLPVPREPMRLTGSADAPCLIAVESGADYTKGMLEWAEKKTELLLAEELCGFIFKTRSPSSGLNGVKIYDIHGTVHSEGRGLFAALFIRKFPLVPVIDDEMLQYELQRERFIEQIFILHRWHDFVRNDGSLKGLRAFHESHKLIIMAHSIKHSRSLGSYIARMHGSGRVADDGYIKILMEGLTVPATIRKHINVLSHVSGYFKKNLSAQEKKDLLHVLELYRGRRVPLLVPVTLLNHYSSRYNEHYLQNQLYLNPDPRESMLRYHV